MARPSAAPNAIEVAGLGKRYRLGAKAPDSLRDAIVGKLRPQRADATRDVWSLRDVSFEIREGEVVGIIGRNGAGKSTLLKLLSRITEPTEGVSRTRGRVASLLEVGTGFHPELTGRENVYLNGAILGMSRRAITARFDEIVDFAGIGPFVDTPIKRYSSGMQLRLAFAVAAHVEPEILVVDEVLAVGDAEFQRKSMAGMSKVGAAGKTVVLVSHDLDAIGRLCTRTIWLDKGRLRMDGPTADVIDAYLASTRTEQSSVREIADDRGRATLHRVDVVDRAGQPTSLLRRDAPVTIEIELSVHQRTPGLDIAVYVLNQRGVRVLDEVWSDTVEERPAGPGRFVASMQIPPVLNVGQYSVGVWIGQGFDEFFSVDGAASFSLEGNSKGRPDRIVEVLAPWSCRATG